MKRERHNKALIHALTALHSSPISPYVNDVLLYGSCARGKEKCQSDVDLLVVLKENAPVGGKFSMMLLDTGSNMMPYEEDVAETDVHFASNDAWLNRKSTYYDNVRREGISVWSQG